MPHDWSALERDLRRHLPPRAVLAKRQELLSYDCDGLTLERHCPPLAVLPETTEQVSKVLGLCHRHRIPFVARGSGTGLSGGALVDQSALLVVTSRMRKVLAIDLDNHAVTVQPGVINSWVTRAVAGEGFYYAPDPSSQVVCSIGGNVAEGASVQGGGALSTDTDGNDSLYFAGTAEGAFVQGNGGADTLHFIGAPVADLRLPKGIRNQKRRSTDPAVEGEADDRGPRNPDALQEWMHHQEVQEVQSRTA